MFRHKRRHERWSGAGHHPTKSSGYEICRSQMAGVAPPLAPQAQEMKRNVGNESGTNADDEKKKKMESEKKKYMGVVS